MLSKTTYRMTCAHMGFASELDLECHFCAHMSLTFRLDCNSREETVHIDCGRSFDCTFRCHNILCTYEFRHILCHFRSGCHFSSWNSFFDIYTFTRFIRTYVALHRVTTLRHFISTSICRYMSHVTTLHVDDDIPTICGSRMKFRQKCRM